MIILAIFTSSCGHFSIFIKNDHTVVPSGKIIVKPIEVSQIKGIEMRTLGNVKIHQGDRESLTITGPDNLVPLVKADNINGVLVLDMERHVNLFDLAGSHNLIFDIQVKELDSIKVSGLGDVNITGQAERLAVGIPGSGEVMAGDFELKEALVNISGLGSATVWATDKLTGKISGSGCVSYYCDPVMETSSTGLGIFKSLGNWQSS